jgi:hypothetical protein
MHWVDSNCIALVAQDKTKIDFINLTDGKNKEMNFTKEKVNHCVSEVDGLRILT